ncbi:MAG: ribonuclease HII [Gammaproteobacteria bacterium]
MELVAGVDEAGRGPLAGPVFAAAVIFDGKAPVQGVRDSKQLTPRRREQLAERIAAQALAWAIGYATAEEIDALNVLQSSLLAMGRAVRGLTPVPHRVLVDGRQCPALAVPVQGIVKGDALVPVISAASILAKVARDREMLALHEIYPQYGFAQHKGYPTSAHLAALRRYGPCPIHRRTFRPVQALLDFSFPLSPSVWHQSPTH